MKKEEEKPINCGHFILPAILKDSACASLRPKRFTCTNLMLLIIVLLISD